MKIDYHDFMIFFTFLLFWVSIQFGELVEDSIAYFLILSLGIIHGANDLIILNRQEEKRSGFFRSLIVYLFLMIICIVSFLINSFVSLLLFILISAYHFGEQHFEKKIEGPNFIKYTLYILYGLVIFLMIFIENMKDVDQIVSDLTGKYFSEEFILTTLIVSFSLLVLTICYSFLRNYHLKINPVKEIFYLIVLYLVFKTSSLILGFAIYFIFWHSIPSIIDQTRYLWGISNRNSIINYFKTALLIWIISILGLMILYHFIEKNLFRSIIFLILFTVTAPHVWVMYRMKIKT